MYIKQLVLTNFRGFEGSTILNFPKNLTVLIGINGAGKSSVLDALSILLNQFIYYTSNIQHNTKFELSDINKNSRKANLEIKINTNQDITFSRGSGFGFASLNVKELKKYGDNFQNTIDEDTSIPIILYYAVHQIDKKKESYATIFSKFNIYKDALGKSKDLQDFVDWFKEQTNLENQYKIEQRNFNFTIKELEIVRQALYQFLGSLSGVTFKNPRIGISDFSKNRKKEQVFLIDKNGSTLEYEQLSEGEKSILSLVFDISYRLAIANPKMENALEGKGVVLIDEIDTHLHPSWQKSILNCLMTAFPNIQFIVTAHSALVVNQVKKENIFIVENNKVIPLQEKLTFNNYGATVEEILKIVQGTTELLPNEVANLFDKYFQFIEDNNIEAAQKIQTELKSLIDPNHPELLKGQTLIDLKALL